MKNAREELLDKIDEAIVLSRFKTFCDQHSSVSEKQRLRNILRRSPDHATAIANIFWLEQGISLSQAGCRRMTPLIKAFINKSVYRKRLDISERQALLFFQGNCCAICRASIDLHAHADHIVPFKYVGDELDNNLQMLCPRCNEKKKASIDYQIKYLLELA